MIVRFICGCRRDVVPGDYPDAVNTPTGSVGVGYDDDGMLVCLPHMQRRSGWRSIPVHEGNETGNAGRPKKSYFGHTPRDIEQHIVFGTPFPQRTVDVIPGKDFRDVRDPEELGNMIQNKRFSQVREVRKMSASELMDHYSHNAHSRSGWLSKD